MEGPKEQPKQHKCNLPSPQSRVDGQVSLFIKRGLNLANEIEATLASSSNPPDLNQTRHSGNQDFAGQEYDLREITQPPRVGPVEETTKIQANRPNQPLLEPETMDEASWAIVWFRRGLHKYNLLDYLGAQDNFKQALLKHPTMAAAHNGLGGVLYKRREFVEAIFVYNQALKYAPQNAQIHCNLGSAHYRIQSYDEAVLAYEQAIHFNPHLQFAYYGLGLAYFRIGLHEEAATAFSQATQLNTQHADSFLGLGVTLYFLEDAQEAMMALHQAMQLNPQYMETYLIFLNVLYL